MTETEGETLAAREMRYILERAANPPLVPPPLPLYGPPIHYTELPEATAGDSLFTEWGFYRREAGRLIAEGHEGRWVLIVGEQVVGFWDSEIEIWRVARERYAGRTVLVHRILTMEPTLRTPTFFYRCPPSPSRPLRAAG